MKTAVVALTRGGCRLAEQIASQLDGAVCIARSKQQKIGDILAAAWPLYDGIVCIMAAGIVVRAIGPLLQDKESDPCVVVMDEKGRHVISLLSGHIGGGNALCHTLAEITGGTAVITTASDTLGLAALDLWARDQRLVPPPRQILTKLSSRLVSSGELKLYSDVEVDSLPAGLTQVESSTVADIFVSAATILPGDGVYFRPRHLVVGVGCNRGSGAGEFEDALGELFSSLGLCRSSIRNLASIDKKSDEQGLLQFASDNRLPIDFFDKEAINTIKNLEISFAALKAVGAIGVAEPAALLSAQSNILLSRKRKWKNITMAVAQAPFTLSEQAPVHQSI
ncbi:MAG: cobalt-precorrin 5A hydrolase [Desulforhopalus sp.]